MLLPDLVFAPRYPIFIFGWLIILCLAISFIINIIHRQILNLTEKYLLVFWGSGTKKNQTSTYIHEQRA
jgi:hypothetical protein